MPNVWTINPDTGLFKRKRALPSYVSFGELEYVSFIASQHPKGTVNSIVSGQGQQRLLGSRHSFDLTIPAVKEAHSFNGLDVCG